MRFDRPQASNHHPGGRGRKGAWWRWEPSQWQEGSPCVPKRTKTNRGCYLLWEASWLGMGLGGSGDGAGWEWGWGGQQTLCSVRASRGQQGALATPRAPSLLPAFSLSPWCPCLPPSLTLCLSSSPASPNRSPHCFLVVSVTLSESLTLQVHLFLSDGLCAWVCLCVSHCVHLCLMVLVLLCLSCLWPSLPLGPQLSHAVFMSRPLVGLSLSPPSPSVLLCPGVALHLLLNDSESLSVSLFLHLSSVSQKVSPPSLFFLLYLCLLFTPLPIL